MANEAQRDYWNNKAGLRWVEQQAALDRSLQDVGRVLFEHAAAAAGERVIDVGCGTGATVLETARRVGPTGHVLGVDISQPMLDVARRRTAGLAQVELLLADAQTHGFAAGACDLVMSRFGVMFFEAPAQAFANLRRALKPGGRLRFVCWGPPKENPWFGVPMQAAIRRLGPPEPTPPRAPGPMAFAEADYVREILGAAGFADIAVEAAHPMMVGEADVETEARFGTTSGPLARFLAAKQPDAATLEALIADIAEGLKRYLTPDGVRVPAMIWRVSGRAP